MNTSGWGFERLRSRAMDNVLDLSSEILRQLRADFVGRGLSSDALIDGYTGLTLVLLRKELSESGASNVDFDLALKDLEEAGLVNTGPLVPYDNPPNSQLLFVGLWSKREYVSLTEKGYKAAQRAPKKTRVSSEPMKSQARKRFAVGARVLVTLPGLVGVVATCDDTPTVMGEYWHVIRTEHGERKEPGCNLDLVPLPVTNAPAPTAHGGVITNVFHAPVGNVAQNSHHVTQHTEITPGISDLEKLVIDFTAHLAELNLNELQARRVKAQLATIQAQLSDEPDMQIVRQAGRTIRSITEGAIGSLIATAATQPTVWHWIHRFLSTDPGGLPPRLGRDNHALLHSNWHGNPGRGCPKSCVNILRRK